MRANRELLFTVSHLDGHFVEPVTTIVKCTTESSQIRENTDGCVNYYFWNCVERGAFSGNAISVQPQEVGTNESDRNIMDRF